MKGLHVGGVMLSYTCIALVDFNLLQAFDLRGEISASPLVKTSWKSHIKSTRFCVQLNFRPKTTWTVVTNHGCDSASEGVSRSSGFFYRSEARKSIAVAERCVR